MKKLPDKLLVVTFLLFLAVPGLSRAADELQQMKAVFKAPPENEVLAENWSEQVTAARRLEYFGLSDPTLFDVIEANLLLAYKGSSKAEVEYTGWMVKALGFSGQDKYLDIIQVVAEGAANKRSRGYAEQAAQVLPSYTQWNSIISSKENYRPDKSAAVNRYANMLRSGVPELQRLAAKRISFEKRFDELLLTLLDEQVRANVASESDDKEFVDAMAWMTKMLAASGQPGYRPTVELVAEKASSNKLRSYADKYLSSYY